jgi:hypothetical protein
MEYRTITEYIQDEFNNHIKANTDYIVGIEEYGYRKGLLKGLWMACMDNIIIHKMWTWEQALNYYNNLAYRMVKEDSAKWNLDKEYVPFEIDLTKIECRG